MPPRARASTPKPKPSSSSSNLEKSLSSFGGVEGLRIDQGILAFEFQPSVGILARNIEKFGLDIRSFREPLQRAVKEVMIPSIMKNFDEEGRPDWDELSDVTIDIRQREGTSGKILNRSGQLKRNMSYISMWDINGERAIIKDLPSRVWYGKVHQAGYGTMGTRIRNEIARAGRSGERISPDEASRRVMSQIDASLKKAMATGKKASAGAAPIPARPFVMIQPEDEDDIRRVFDDWMEERMRRAGWT